MQRRRWKKGGALEGRICNEHGCQKGETGARIEPTIGESKDQARQKRKEETGSKEPKVLVLEEEKKKEKSRKWFREKNREKLELAEPRVMACTTAQKLSGSQRREIDSKRTRGVQRFARGSR